MDEINGYGMGDCNNLQCPFVLTSILVATWMDQRGSLGAIKNHTRCYKKTYSGFVSDN